jgi:hypothetical protein
VRDEMGSSARGLAEVQVLSLCLPSHWQIFAAAPELSPARPLAFPPALKPGPLLPCAVPDPPPLSLIPARWHPHREHSVVGGAPTSSLDRSHSSTHWIRGPAFIGARLCDAA